MQNESNTLIYDKTNNFGMLTQYTPKDIQLCKLKIKNDTQNSKYIATHPYKGFKYPIEDFIILTVRGYSKPTINLKTYCNYN